MKIKWCGKGVWTGRSWYGSHRASGRAQVQFEPHTNKECVLYMPAIPALGKWRQEDEKFKGRFYSVGSLRPASGM